MTLSKTHTKYIQSLQHKKFRDEFDVFIAEGPKVVMELLSSRVFVCRELYALEDWLQDNQPAIAKYDIETVAGIKDFELEKISALSTPNTVFAVFRKRAAATIKNYKGKITLVLDTIQDPGNMGTIIRIADWFGVENIICSPDCADCYNNKVVQSTMGSLARVNIIYINIEEWLKKNNNIISFAATMDGSKVQNMNGIKEGIIIIGNEGKGISNAVLALAKESITIPRIGGAESLNAAVAAGIILSHL